MFKIITDTGSDLPEAYLKAHDIDLVCLSYIVEEEVYGKEQTMPCKVFYDMMRKGSAPTTSQANPEDAKAVIERALQEHDEILCLGFSSGLSGTCNSIRIAAEDLMSERPDCRIAVVDTLAASLGQGLLVHKAVEMRDAGKSMNETAEWVEKHRLNLVHMFTVDDLEYLYRGGRVSKTTAFVGGLVGIKPVLHVDDEGHLIAVGKVRGRKKSLCALVDAMGEKMGGFRTENDIVFISHCDDWPAAEFVKEQVKERFGIESFLIDYVGPTIGAHSGPGTVALFFMGEHR